MDLPLLQWLQTYTFPCEAKFQDEAFARAAYGRSVARHLRSGTTMASYFATIHKEASKILAEVLTAVGQRAFVGPSTARAFEWFMSVCMVTFIP